MKGLKKLLAIALSALLMLLPTAMAEGTTAVAEAHTVTISNPGMSVAGIALADLEGLSIEATAADAGGNAAFVLRVLGGEEVAAEGYALTDGRQLVLGAKGLTDAYAVPLEKMMDEESTEAMEQLSQLFSEDTLVALLNAVIVPFGTLVEDFMATQVDEGVQMIDHTVGTIEMQGYTFTMTAQMLSDWMDSVVEGVENIPIIAQFMQQGMGAAAYNDEKTATTQLEGEYTITLWAAADESGIPIIREEICFGVADGDDMPAVSAWVDIYPAGDDYQFTGEATVPDGDDVETMAVSGRYINYIPALQGGDMGAVGMEMELLVSADDGETGEISINYYPMGYDASTADRSTLDVQFNITDDGEANFVGLEGYYSPADGVNYLYDELYGVLSIGSSGYEQTMELTMQMQHANGVEYYGAQLAVSDPYSGSENLYYTYEGTYTENALGTEDNTGRLTLGMGMGYGDNSIAYEVAADVAVTHALVDASTLPTIEGEPVNLLMLDEKGMDQLESEGEILAMQLVGVLSANVPGLMSLMTGATSY